MGIAVITFVDGDVMVAADIRSNIGTVEGFVNRGIAGSDISAGSIKTRHLVKPESYGSAAGGPRTICSSGAIHGRSVNGAHADRAVHSYSGMGPNVSEVAGGCATFWVPTAGKCDITCNAWVWYTHSEQTTCEYRVEGQISLAVDGSRLGYTRKEFWDAGKNPAKPDGYGGSFYHYAARNMSMVAQENLTSGFHTIKLVCDLYNESPAGRARVGARNLVVEYYAK